MKEKERTKRAERAFFRNNLQRDKTRMRKRVRKKFLKFRRNTELTKYGAADCGESAQFDPGQETDRSAEARAEDGACHRIDGRAGDVAGALSAAVLHVDHHRLAAFALLKNEKKYLVKAEKVAKTNRVIGLG